MRQSHFAASNRLLLLVRDVPLRSASSTETQFDHPPGHTHGEVHRWKQSFHPTKYLQDLLHRCAWSIHPSKVRESNERSDLQAARKYDPLSGQLLLLLIRMQDLIPAKD